jgi:hypothetical protein
MGTIMSLLEKKNSELTAADRKAMRRSVGSLDMPYPGIRTQKDADGKIIERKLGVITDSNLALYSDRSEDEVTGLLFRNMASHNLLFAQQEIIAMMAPDSNNRFVVLLGEPGNGKTELAKTIAWASDSRGPLTVDCGGRYMSDMLWEKVIDYGEGSKTALTDCIRNNQLSTNSKKIFEESLPGALIWDKDGKETIGINWDRIGEAQETAKSTKEKPDFEKTEVAAERDLKLIQEIATLEGIPPQAVNSIGIKKQHGIIMRAFQSGQKLIFDEITKSKVDGDDALQTVFQFFNGEIDAVTVQNDMKVSGHPETDDFTFRREDMPIGFGVIATGNLESDGVSTHAFSLSQNSRFIKFTSGKPQLDDWKHQFAREMTGMPFTTVQLVLPGAAKSDPEGFGDALVQTCQKGLAAQQTKVTPEKLTHLKNWEDTGAAIDMLAKFYMFFEQLVDPMSELNSRGPLNWPDDNVNKAIMVELGGEVKKDNSMSFRDQCAVDPRKIIQDMANTLRKKPNVQAVDENSGLRLNPSAIGRQDLPAPVDNPEETSGELGTRMEQVLIARVGSMMADKPGLNKALLAKMKQLGITASPEFKGKTLAELLDQPLIPGLGGTGNAYSLRNVLLSHLRNADRSLVMKPDDAVVTMEQANDAFEDLGRLSANSTGTSPSKGRIILLGPDLKHAFNEAAAVDSINNQNRPAPADLIPASAFLETLKVPALAELNMQAIWRNTVSVEGLIEPSDVTTPVVDIAENKYGLGITTLRMQGANGKEVLLNVMLDNERRKALIVTDDKVESETKTMLDREGYTVVSLADPGAEARTAEFIRETLEQPSRKSSRTEDEKNLTYAFLMRAGDAGNEAQLQPLKKLMTGNLPAPKAIYMIKQP